VLPRGEDESSQLAFTDHSSVECLPPKLYHRREGINLSDVIYACFAVSGSAFLDFRLNGLRIFFFHLANMGGLLAIGVLGTYH
jgi:hypothetical protein